MRSATSPLSEICRLKACLTKYPVVFLHSTISVHIIKMHFLLPYNKIFFLISQSTEAAPIDYLPDFILKKEGKGNRKLHLLSKCY